MKKTLSIALVMLVIFSMLTGCTKSGNKKDNISLKESPVSDFEYTISSTNAIIIDKYILNSFYGGKQLWERLMI